MFNVTILTILLLIGFIIFQRITILRYKKLSISEKTFLASLTHDLKSPARAQINMLNLLLKGNFGELNPQQHEMIRMTCTSSKYMSNLVGMILANYKYEQKTVSLNKKYFDIIKLINDILKQNKYLISDNNLNVIFIPKETESIIYADELQIERVIFNLLSNAITYATKGTEIKINLNQNLKFTEFTISNHSEPLSQKELNHIFRKFSAFKNSAINKDTTGLGLYTAKKIIDKHNGIIYAKNTPNNTITFGFKLRTIPQERILEKEKI